MASFLVNDFTEWAWKSNIIIKIIGLQSFPGWLLSPDGFFPGKTFPGWSFSRMRQFLMINLQAHT